MSDAYFSGGAVESCATIEQDQGLAEKCGPNRPIDAESVISALPAPVRVRRRPDVPTWTYFLRADDTIKIGRSTNPQSRAYSIRTGNHAEVTLIAAVPDALAYETDLHSEFADLRIRGEWFRAEPALLNRIAELRDEWENKRENYKPKREPGVPVMPTDTIGKLMWLARHEYKHQPKMRDHLELLREQTIALKKARSDDERKAVRRVMATTATTIENIQRTGDLDLTIAPIDPVDLAIKLGLRPA